MGLASAKGVDIVFNPDFVASQFNYGGEIPFGGQ